MRSTLRLFALLFCGFGAITALNWSLGWFDGDDVQHLLDSASSHPWRVGLFVVALLAVDSVLSVPTMGTAAVAGHLLGAGWGALAASLGVMTAGSICFFTARLFRDRPVGDRLREELGPIGPVPLLFSRAVPMLPESLSVMAGVAGMSTARYWLWFALGNVPFVAAAAAAGSVSGIDRPWPALFAAVGLPLLAGLGYVVHRRRRRLAEARD